MEAEGVTYVPPIPRRGLRGFTLIFGIGRLRFLWGFISVLVILWLLATASNDRPSESTDLQVKVGHFSSPPTIRHMGDSWEL